MDSALESERERELEWERPNGLLLMPNASASIDRVDGSLVRFLTNMNRPFESRSIHVLPESGSMDWKNWKSGRDGAGEER